MNAHQRRKARRAKEREPWVLHIPADNSDWVREWMKPVDVPEGVRLLTGEIGQIDGGITFVTRPAG